MNLFTKFSIPMAFAISSMVVSLPALAVPAGQCSADAGTKAYSFSFVSTMTDPSQNVAGKVIPNAAGSSWSGGGTYQASCGCSTMTAAYVTATSALPTLDHTDGTMNYYVLNEFLAVGSRVWIGGGVRAYKDVPITNFSNANTQSGPCNSQPYASGSQGQINLYFRRPFVGQNIIPMTKLLDVYIASSSGTTSATPVSTVSMSGTVTVPQNCSISPDPVTVNFGDILAGNFKTKNQMPNGFTKVTKQLTLACSNISQGVVINLTFQGTPDTNDTAALKTNNSDIAVKLEDAAGTAIVPLSGKLPVAMNYSAQTGSSTFNLYPINTTGNLPNTGVFNATATIRVEIQ